MSNSNLIRFIGRRICTLRELRGLTQRDLAERTGVGHAELSKIENGQRAASLITLDHIARGLETTLTVLLDNEQPLDALRDVQRVLATLREATPEQRAEAMRVLRAVLAAATPSSSDPDKEGT